MFWSGLDLRCALWLLALAITGYASFRGIVQRAHATRYPQLLLLIRRAQFQSSSFALFSLTSVAREFVVAPLVTSFAATAILPGQEGIATDQIRATDTSERRWKYSRDTARA